MVWRFMTLLLIISSVECNEPSCANFKATSNCTGAPWSRNGPDELCTVIQNTAVCDDLTLGGIGNSQFPSAARELKIDPYVYKMKNRPTTTVSIKFKLPNDDSLRYLKGFKLELFSKRSPICRVFNLTLATWKHKLSDYKDKVFIYNCFISLYPLEDYEVVVTSLPRPPLGIPVKNVSLNFLSLQERDVTKSSSKWSTWIVYNNKVFTEDGKLQDGLIDVEFGRDPNNRFRAYTVTLVNVLKNTSKQKTVSHNGMPSAKFENVCSGIYKITVTPVDDAAFIDGYCRCLDVDGNCGTCITTTTKKFKFTSNCGNKTTITEITPTLTSTLITRNYDNGFTGIVGVVLGVVFLVVIIVVVASVVYRRKHAGNCNYVRHMTTPTRSNSPLVSGDLNDGKKLKVLLYDYSNDGNHRDIVRLFCKFVSESGNIEFKLADACVQEINRNGNLSQWVMKMTDWADRIVVINSRQSFYFYRNKTVETNRTIRMNVFRTAIDQYQKQYLDDEILKSKMVMVYFSYDDKSCIIPTFQNGVAFCLMEQFEQFFLHINNHDPINSLDFTVNKVENLDVNSSDCGRNLIRLINDKPLSSNDSGFESNTAAGIFRFEGVPISDTTWLRGSGGGGDEEECDDILCGVSDHYPDIV